MIGGRQWAIKKFLRGYAVTIVTSALLILILALLIWARLGDLYSIRDISKINPLITSGQNELVAVRDNNGISSFVKESSRGAKTGDSSGESTTDTTNGADTKTTQSPDGSTSSGVNNGQSTGGAGGATGGNGGGNGNTGDNTGNEVDPVPGVFSVTISDMGQTKPLSVGLTGTSCKSTHKFYATVTAQNGPGMISYRWKQSNGVTSATQQLPFSGGGSSKTVSAPQWDISGDSGSSYSMTFEIVSPKHQQQTINFQHECPILGIGL